jgi:uncharacterized FAD-dependent dehydrogenase
LTSTWFCCVLILLRPANKCLSFHLPSQPLNRRCHQVYSPDPVRLAGGGIVLKSTATRTSSTKSSSSPSSGPSNNKNTLKGKVWTASSRKGGRSSGAGNPRKPPPTEGSKDSQALETWRIFDISVHPDDLAGAGNDNDDDDDDDNVDNVQDRTNLKNILVANDSDVLPVALQRVLVKKLKLDVLPLGTKVVRRSLDARKKLDHPSYKYVVDIPIQASVRRTLGWKFKAGQMEKISDEAETITTASTSNNANGAGSNSEKKTVVVVGMGPAGLFCALKLALQGVRPILLDRGQPVEKRGRDIGALIHRRSLDEESNFAFGEGGAGTWSDGKLTTRIGRNSGTVRWVLQTLVDFGAPSNILWEGAPHLGTDNLVRLLRSMRHRMEELGGEIHFGTKMTGLVMEGQKMKSITAEQKDGKHISFEGDAFVLATGHSARDVYESLHHSGVKLEPKGFSVGFRIEHPQAIINQIQYGDEWGVCVKTGKSLTDAANEDYFGEPTEHHIARMPVPSYRLATDQAKDGSGNQRGVYSFCMCPGGQIVPSSTDPNEVCVNGMSFSRRDSKWANSALVVTVAPDDEILKDYRTHGVLAGLEFQRDMERRASSLGGGNLTVPVQRMTDFIDGIVSSTIPSSSYRLGVKSAPCHEIYPEPITTALRDALSNHFRRQMPGYFHPDGLLHAVETRTSSPLRVSRDRETYTAVGTENLFPAGEGAGYAGGIVSAAVDGVNVAEAILDSMYGESRPNRNQKGDSVGFSY